MGSIPAFAYLTLALGALGIAAALILWVLRYASSGETSSKESADSSPAAVTPEPEGEQELLRVVRTEKGELAISVQGRRYRHLRAIRDRQVGSETVEAIQAVLAFAEGFLPSSQRPAPQPDSSESTVDPDAFLEQLRRSDIFTLGSRSQSPLEAPLIPVEYINDLVQKRLLEQPDLAGRYVSLSTNSSGSLYIEVDHRTFEAVGDIPEPQVRALIQEAIREWESNYAEPA